MEGGVGRASARARKRSRKQKKESVRRTRIGAAPLHTLHQTFNSRAWGSAQRKPLSLHTTARRSWGAMSVTFDADLFGRRLKRLYEAWQVRLWARERGWACVGDERSRRRGVRESGWCAL